MGNTRHRHHFRGFQQVFRGLHADDVEPLEERLIEPVITDKGRGVAHGHGSALPGDAGLEHDDGLAGLEGAQRGPAEGCSVGQRFHEESERGDGGIVDENLDVVGEVEDGLVAAGNDVGERGAAPAVGDVDADVAALSDEGAPLRGSLPQGGRRHRKGAVDVVVEAIAVGSDDGEIACPLPKFLLQGDAIPSDFRIARRIADSASCPHVVELRNQLIGHLPVDRQEDDIGWCVEFVDGPQARFAGDRLPPRIDDADIPGKPQVPGRGNGRLEEGTADEADAGRI